MLLKHSELLAQLMGIALDNNIKRLNNKKLNLWKNIRAKRITAPHPLIDKFRALNRLINSSIRQATLCKEAQIIGCTDIKQFYRYANSKLSNKSNSELLKLQMGN